MADYSSIKASIRKESKKFIEDRFYRLFIPFLFVGTILMLIAHVPAYLMGHNSFDVYLYLKDFFIHEKWPVGPPWFIGVLFIFNVFFAFLSNILRRLSFSENGLYKIANLIYWPSALYLGWMMLAPIANINLNRHQRDLSSKHSESWVYSCTCFSSRCREIISTPNRSDQI